VRCSAFRSRCINCDPFPYPTIAKCSKRLFAWCEVGACTCRARCCGCPVTGTRAQPWENWQGGSGQHPIEPAQAPRQVHRTTPKTPDTNYGKGVQSCKRRSLVSVQLSGNPSSCGGPCHGSVLEKWKAPTHMLPCFQAGSTSKTLP
jgi:hypothetical protein